MSKIVSAERHDEVMEKLDTALSLLYTLAAQKKTTPAVEVRPAFWEQQCREKDATLTETLRKLQAAEAQITEVVGKNSAYVDEILRQREEIAVLNEQLANCLDATYKGVQIDCPATRAALDAIIKDFLLRPKVKA